MAHRCHGVAVPIFMRGRLKFWKDDKEWARSCLMRLCSALGYGRIRWPHWRW
ncbi:hypothetical protein JKG47_21100 [Acidithiobacillus sp. MC6.1]|nr:hypothetical protein [Acidithiobacillus sp. MC6.1]